MKNPIFYKVLKSILYVVSIACLCFVSGEFFIRAFASFYNPAFRAFVKEEAYRGAQSSLRVAHGTQIVLKESDFKKRADIVAVGDSMVFGSLSKESELWTTQLSNNTGLAVLNMGVGSQSPCGYNYMLRTALDKLPGPPPVVLYAVFADDITEGPCRSDACYKGLFIWQRAYDLDFKLRLRMFREWAFQHSVLYQYMKRILTFNHIMAREYFKPVFSKDGDTEFAFTPVWYWKRHLNMDDPVIAQELERTIDKIVTAKNLAQRGGSEFILILMPFKEQIYAPLFIKKGLVSKDVYDESYDLLYDELFSRTANLGIETVDLRSSFRSAAERGKKLFWTLDGHFTPEGNLVTANALTARLKNMTKHGSL